MGWKYGTVAGSVCAGQADYTDRWLMHACVYCLIRTLYDVFRNVADDEKEHVKTMKACRDYSIVDDLAKKKLTHREAMQAGGAGLRGFPLAAVTSCVDCPLPSHIFS